MSGMTQQSGYFLVKGDAKTMAIMLDTLLAEIPDFDTASIEVSVPVPTQNLEVLLKLIK